MLLSCEPKEGVAKKVFVYCQIDKVPSEDWNSLLTESDIYLDLKYLISLESTLTDLEFRYVLAYNGSNKPIAIYYFQLIRVSTKHINPDAIIRKVGNVLPDWLVSKLEAKISICGNAFCSGEHGFRLANGINVKSGFDLLDQVLEELKQVEKELHQKKISLTLLKEYWPQSQEKMQKLLVKGFHEGQIDANMVFKLNPTWKNFEDYTAAMKAKFRTKLHKAEKLASELIVMDMTAPEMEKHHDQLNELYMSMVKHAEFSFAHLNANAFIKMKKQLGDAIYFKGYFLKDKLIGFALATCFDQVVDGNFIGLNYDYNKSHAVYQNILYDFVRHAFKIGANEIRIGRTAEEIKSGVGAEPIPMTLYARHRNKLTNKILKKIIENLEPSQFEMRKPFKAEFYN